MKKQASGKTHVKKKLAVVVPMFNVELFLQECLDSLLGQGLESKEMQIILIDDGSTDGTVEIAKRYVNKHPRFFELHEFENAGLGAARNRGMSFASAKYITFVDSDDKVADNSYKKMLDIIERTGSQVITGGVRRFTANRTTQSYIHARSRELVNSNIERTNYCEQKDLVWDTTSWNKIYLFSLIKENNLTFPEGKLYEDMAFVAKAFGNAKSIDIYKDTMYLWRVREAGSHSITELVSELKSFSDRFFAIKDILSFLDSKNFQALRTSTVDKLLNFDILLPIKKEKYQLLNLTFKENYFKSVKEVLLLLSKDEFDLTPFKKRYLYKVWLSKAGFDQLDKLLYAHLREEDEINGIWNKQESYELESIFNDELNIEMTTQAIDLEPVVSIKQILFNENGVEITAKFFAKYSDMSKDDLISNLKLSYENELGKIASPVGGTIKLERDKKTTSRYGYNKTHFNIDGNPEFNYDYSSLIISIPFSDFFSIKNMRLKISAEIDGFFIETYIKNPTSSSSAHPRKVIVKHTEYEAAFTENWILELICRDNVPIIEVNNNKVFFVNFIGKPVLSSGRLKLSLPFYREQLNFNSLFLVKLESLIRLWGRLRSHVKMLDKDVFKWQIIDSGRSEQVPASMTTANYLEIKELKNYRITLFSDGGFATIMATKNYPNVHRIELLNDDEISMVVRLPKRFNLCNEIFLTNNIDGIVGGNHIAGQKLSNRKWKFILPLEKNFLGGRDEKVSYLMIHAVGENVIINENLSWGTVPDSVKNVDIISDNVNWRFCEDWKYTFSGVALIRTSDRSYWENYDSYNQFLENHYQEWIKEPLLEDTIMWSSFWGNENKFIDNPRHLYDYVVENYPSYHHIVVLEDVVQDYSQYHNTIFIANNTKVYWFYLAKAKFFVNNVNFGGRARIKRDDQVEIQTTHGIPLKTLGFENPLEWSNTSETDFLRRNKSWDYLVAPSEYVADTFMRAYKVTPQILRTGYPRNDIFFRNPSEDIEKKKRNMVGEDKLVLYLPTWRRIGNASIDEFIDIKSLYENLPSNTHVVIKPHRFVDIIEVENDYFDKITILNKQFPIEELYLMADCIITDYSSVMFDGILTGKPIIFFVPDYDDYANRRGFFISLKEIAPGPLVYNQVDLTYWLNHYNEITLSYSEKIKEFKNRFLAYETGEACKQIADKFFIS